ncbi:MAG: YceI family protein [Proteobacteria bacterium]|nr:YceI family protein [Pseudomonadota bacterium]
MRSFLLAASLLALTACVEDVGEGKAAATVEEVPAEAVPADAAAKGTELPVDASQGSIRALGAKVTATHPIDFGTYSGAVTLDGETPTAVRYEIQMDTLEADHPKLTSHLKDADFFEVSAHPTSTFVSTAVAEGSDVEGATHTVTGDLTIRGTAKRVSFPATFELSPASVTANAEFVINRQDFKIVYAGRADDLIQDNVAITVKLVAPRS